MFGICGVEGRLHHENRPKKAVRVVVPAYLRATRSVIIAVCVSKNPGILCNRNVEEMAK